MDVGIHSYTWEVRMLAAENSPAPRGKKERLLHTDWPTARNARKREREFFFFFSFFLFSRAARDSPLRRRVIVSLPLSTTDVHHPAYVSQTGDKAGEVESTYRYIERYRLSVSVKEKKKKTRRSEKRREEEKEGERRGKEDQQPAQPVCSIKRKKKKKERLLKGLGTHIEL